MTTLYISMRRRGALTWGVVAALALLSGCGDSTTDPTTGDLRAGANTTGTDTDPDGYVVAVDGGQGQALGPQGSVVFQGLPPGQHEVSLSDVAANCSVAGSNPRMVSVAAGGTAETTFIVACSEITGSLEVSTSTSGDDIDPDGYLVSVDGGAGQAVGTSETITITGLSSGLRQVTLGDVAPNCTVAGENPRTVDVASGGTASTTFSVTCSELVGSIEASTTTTGSDIDADGYELIVDGGAPVSIGVNDTQTLLDIAPGMRQIELSDVAANCQVSGANPMSVDVPAGGSVPADFVVTCAEQVGSLEVTTVTWGLGTDNSYTVSVDGGGSTSIGGNDTETLNAIPAGDRSVTLSGLASNCTVQGPNPRTETITEGATTSTTFDVFCFQTLSGKIVFESRRGSEPGDIYVMNTNGTGQTRLTLYDGLDREPDVAPSGIAVVFESDRDGNRDIWIMDQNGIRNLTTSSATHRSPSFSANSNRVAYARRGSTSWRLYSISYGGGSLLQITDDAGDDDQPAWSPDGSKILFRSNRSDGVNWDIYVVDADGSNLTRLTTDTAHDGKPAWSSDGSQITWSGDEDGSFDIWIADFDAGARSISNLQNLTPASGATDGKSDWKPGQALIAYSSDGSSDNDIIIIDSNGNPSPGNITNSPYDDREPSWSP